MSSLDAQHQQWTRQARARATLALSSLCNTPQPLSQCSEAGNCAVADTIQRPILRVSDTSSTGCEQTLSARD